MNFPIHTDTIRMGLPIVYFKRLQVEFLNHDVFLSPKIVLTLTKSAEPDEMHLGLHCLQKYLFLGFLNTKV